MLRNLNGWCWVRKRKFLWQPGLVGGLGCIHISALLLASSLQSKDGCQNCISIVRPRFSHIKIQFTSFGPVGSKDDDQLGWNFITRESLCSSDWWPIIQLRESKHELRAGAKVFEICAVLAVLGQIYSLLAMPAGWGWVRKRKFLWQLGPLGALGMCISTSAPHVFNPKMAEPLKISFQLLDPGSVTSKFNWSCWVIRQWSIGLKFCHTGGPIPKWLVADNSASGIQLWLGQSVAIWDMCHLSHFRANLFPLGHASRGWVRKRKFLWQRGSTGASGVSSFWPLCLSSSIQRCPKPSL